MEFKIVPPGSYRAHARETNLVDCFDRDEIQVKPTVLDIGMERVRQAYAVLDWNDAMLLLLERRNDDGEWAPLLFPAPPGLDPTDHDAVLYACWAVGDYAQDVTDEVLEAVRRPGADEDLLALDNMLWDALYGLRDALNPDALSL